MADMSSEQEVDFISRELIDVVNDLMSLHDKLRWREEAGATVAELRRIIGVEPSQRCWLCYRDNYQLDDGYCAHCAAVRDGNM